jgi:nucleotide-binding universal stress UspA family protein
MNDAAPSDQTAGTTDPETDSGERLVRSGGEGPTIMVALANPRTERDLITLASALAEHEGGRVLAVHIVTVPDQTSLEAAAQNREQIDAESEHLLADAKADAAAFGVPVETKTVLSHRGFEEVFDAARSNDVDAVVMGYGGVRFAGGRAEGKLDELTHDLPCDFLVLDGQDLSLSDVLVPTAGGPSSDLSAEVARALRETLGVDISLLHVVDAGEEESGREFLSDWAEHHQLADADLRVETGDVETILGSVGSEYSLVIVGATERGLLSRIVRGSLAFETIRTLDTPVLLAERPTSRSLRERLFGRR